MKTSLNLFLLVMSSIFVISSCEKPINHPKVDVSTMSGKIDGVLLECSFASAQLYNLDTKTSIQIAGNKGLDGFSLTIDDFKGIGTYNFLNSNIGIYLMGVSGLQDSYMDTEKGNIIITSYTPDQLIEGTFQFESQNMVTSSTKNITEGKFRISLVPVKLPETNASTNNLSAKVDGVTTGFTGFATATNMPPLGKILSIISVNGEKRLVMGITDYKGAGTYDMADNVTASYMKDQTPINSFYAETGTLVITSDSNGRLKGRFSFQGPNENISIKTSVTITDGTFDLPYTIQ